MQFAEDSKFSMTKPSFRNASEWKGETQTQTQKELRKTTDSQGYAVLFRPSCNYRRESVPFLGTQLRMIKLLARHWLFRERRVQDIWVVLDLEFCGQVRSLSEGDALLKLTVRKVTPSTALNT